MKQAFVVLSVLAVLAGILPLTLSFCLPRSTASDGHCHAAKRSGPIDDDGPTGTGLIGRRMPSRPATRERRPRSEARQYPVATKRAPHQFDHTKADARPFINAIHEVQAQDPNADAPVFESDHFTTVSGDVIDHPHVDTKSLDEVFPATKGFSELFSSNHVFRNGIRDAMRQDIFDSTPAYMGMSEKARRMLLLPDSSLQGSWRSQGREGFADGDPRMRLLTKLLQEHLGEVAPTGDEFMDTIGGLCGSSPQTHWIDIVGITDRKISHSWHQDTGRSPNGDTKTVLLGFPREDGYVGGGVFSHLVKLGKEQWAPEGHPPSEPILFTNSIEDKYIVRPQFAKGKEIVIYRDVDVLHSAPDVAYRSSVMRFM